MGQRADSTGESDVWCYRDEAPTQLELIDNEYASTIIETLDGGPRRGRELIETCAGSRSTVYRQLDRLVEAGFVTTEIVLDPDGHHCKLFRLVRDTVTVTVEQGGITVTARRR